MEPSEFNIRLGKLVEEAQESGLADAHIINGLKDKTEFLESLEDDGERRFGRR